jgi:hypothetical protein
MTKKVIMLGILGLAIAGVAAYSTGAFAFRGDVSKTGPNYTPERHEQMTKAFENKDYQAWKDLMGDRGAAKKITEQNFSRFAEMHKLKLEGKNDEVNKIRQELGLGQGNGQGNNAGQRGQNRNGNFVDNNKDGICDRLQ